MGLNIFFFEDIQNALLAADKASTSMARICFVAGGDSKILQAYLEGYRAALSTIALAFGISSVCLKLTSRVIIKQKQIKGEVDNVR